jgi:1-acyl-sn-glycerol-3-phosphate acyltransferase
MNHESMLDIPLIVVASPRPVTFMAKRELFTKRGWARFFHELGGFSVDRDAFDLRAIAIAKEAIRRGDVLGMYPEGTRFAGRLLPFLPGAAWLALATGASLLPAAIEGTGAAMPKEERRVLPRRVPVRIAFGHAIAAPKVNDPAKRRREARELTERVRADVAALLGRT